MYSWFLFLTCFLLFSPVRLFIILFNKRAFAGIFCFLVSCIWIRFLLSSASRYLVFVGYPAAATRLVQTDSYFCIFNIKLLLHTSPDTYPVNTVRTLGSCVHPASSVRDKCGPRYQQTRTMSWHTAEMRLTAETERLTFEQN